MNGTDHLLTPSKITAWLGCDHYLTLRNQVESGLYVPSPTPLNELAEILIDKGITHEAACLEDYEAMGRTVYEVPRRNANETFEEWVTRVDGSLTKGFDVVYQMPFVHDGMRGIADFLVRLDEPVVGYASYEPVDAKLTRNRAKPGHVLQLCFYAEAIAAMTGSAPRQMHLWLGSGDVETYLVEEFSPYWRRLRRQLGVLLASEASDATRPRPCDTCEYCEFQRHCEQQWRAEDSVAFVAGSRAGERDALESAAVLTIAQLARRDEPVDGLRSEKLARLTRQAALQVASRDAPTDPPAFELIEAGEDPVYGHGFELLPEPNEGDVFFDFEGDPFWTPKSDLVFLAGLWYREGDEWVYDGRWAHQLDEQQSMIKGLVDFFARRRATHPLMHVYHYNHTEKSTIERLMRDAEDEQLFASLVESGLFVDLFSVARNAVRVGTESYGLKHLEHLVAFERSSGIEQGAAAVVEYEAWLRTGEPRRLAAIARYNREDVMATRALRDWLVAVRPAGLAWREAIVTREPYELDTDELVERLHEASETTPEYLLGDLLNYWRRERSADVTPKFVAMNGDYNLLYDNPDYITNLNFVRLDEPTGHEKTKRLVLSWPHQTVDRSLEPGEALFAGVGVPYGHGSITAIDVEQRELTLRWGAAQEAMGALPSVVTRDRYYRPAAKASALKDLARQFLDPDVHGSPSRLAMSLLAREVPRFVTGRGPSGGVFIDDLDASYDWVGDLDESFVAFQGPPGAGKTYSGSRMIHHLIMSGKRVGVVAMSHPAIDNLMTATYKVFEAAGDTDQLRTLRRHDDPKTPLHFARYSKKKEDFLSERFNLIGGTAWLWANAETRQNPVDVLVVDEAGQLSLADAVASTNGAHNMILLGDPLQLSQVSKAEHPGGADASILEHVLGEHVTIPNTQGVFISQTWRMHPDVCTFLSQQIYEGRLTSNECCEQQDTAFGTGLRWIEARHRGCSTDSREEAELVCAQIAAMLGSPWVNQRGETRPLTPRDFMVVAPYNDQVNLLSTLLEGDARLSGVQVGTVDKFQGREAPVVFFTMTTSSAEDMPRGPEFLFSRNRLNVAASRARCLVYLVCTEELLNSRAAEIDDMRLISTLSAFVEYADATS